MTAHLAVLVLLAASAAFAQTEPAATPTAAVAAATAAPTATPAGPTLSLSLDDAVKMALEKNPDLIIDRLGPESGRESVREAAGVFDPLLTATVLRSSSVDPVRSTFQGGSSVETDRLEFNVGASKLFSTGGSLSVDFTNGRQEETGFPTFSPAYSSGLSASLNQPLLRDFRMNAQRRQLRIAQRNQEISEAQFRQSVVNTVARVKQLYYDYLYSIDNLEAQRKSLDLATRFLGENRIRVRVGTLAPLDVVAAESEVAGREEAVILAEATKADAQDALRRAIFGTGDEPAWNHEIVPTDRPTAEPITIDVPAAIAQAIENRTDVVVARKNLENAEISAQFGSNQRLPRVDLVARYGAAGLGGTRLVRDTPFGPVVETLPGSYSDALGDVFGRDFANWSVGVNFAYFIPNRGGSAQAARLRIAREQAAAGVKRTELDVSIEVRSAARAVETNYKRVQSTRAARVLQERRLDAENKRFAAGMSTNFLVTQAQRDLVVAEVAELRAIADYRKSLVDFDRVQQAAGSGVSFSTGASRTGGGASSFSGASGAGATGTSGSTGATGSTGSSGATGGGTTPQR